MKQGVKGHRRSGKACVFALIIEIEVDCSMGSIQQAFLINRITRLLSSYTIAFLALLLIHIYSFPSSLLNS